MDDRSRVTPPEVFVSYAHEDEEFRNQLDNHLAVLVKQGVLSVWHDAEIPPGSDWRKEIDEHLERATILLLLVSSDFLASDFCWSVELKHALERHEADTATVIPIIVRPCLWTSAPFASIQALPTGAAPISTWENADEAYQSVAAAIRDAAAATG